MAATTKQTHDSDTKTGLNADLRKGSALMALAGIAFIGYGLVFLVWNFAGGGFELGVDTINGVTRADLNALEPAVLHYISHLHVATAAFIISTGVAVAGLAWYGVREGQHLWAWATAVVAGVLGLVIALPMHWMDLFSHSWLTHLAPIYLAAVVFLIGALLGLRGLAGGGRSTRRVRVP